MVDTQDRDATASPEGEAGTSEPGSGVAVSELPEHELAGSGDAFGHDDYAKAAAAILVQKEPPLTLGLFGPWGLGKTWIIDRIRVHIGKDAAFAYIDVWRYEGDSLRRQFLRDLANQLNPHEAQFDPEKELSDLDEATATKVERFGGLSGDALREAVVRCTLAGVLVFILLQAVGAQSLLDEQGRVKDAVISAAIALILFVLTPITRVFRVNEQVLTRSRLEDPERFGERFVALLIRLKKDRLVVAIDNLDRCNPSRVEELLATIKTYLEPLAAPSKTPWLWRVLRRPKDKVAVFLIAADDDALRRHLEAKEAAASGGRTPKEIAQYVDEYLRKFFTSAIRIRPLLIDDVRAYTDRELDEFAIANGLDESTRIALVEMVAAALSRTPRRVKQFGDNLDARLRVIRARQESLHIDPPISDQVLMIAKIAIIEEEWPKSFAALQQYPPALDEWHNAVVEGTPLATCPDYDDESFRRFLSISRDVRSSNVDAFIRLKQSTEELRLPRYGEFRSAVVQGDMPAVTAIVAAEERQSMDYAQRLRSILDEELSNRYLDGARSVVEAATSVDALAEHRASVVAVLARAVGDSELRGRLTAIQPTPLFRAARWLPAPDQARLLAPFTELHAFLAQSEEKLAQVLEAFASTADTLPKSTRADLTDALADDRVYQQFEAMVALVRADAVLIPHKVAEAAAAALRASPTTDSAPFALLNDWLDIVSMSANIEDSFALSMAAVIADQQATDDSERDPTQIAAALATVADALGRLPSIRDEAASEFFAVVDHPLSTWQANCWPAVLDAIGAVADLAPSASNPLDRLVSEFFAADPASAVEWAAGAGGTFGAALLRPVVAHLQQIALNEKSLRIRAVDALATIDGKQRSSEVANTSSLLIGARLFRTARHALTQHSALVGDNKPALIDQALGQAGGSPSATSVSAALSFFDGVLEDMSDAQLDELRNIAATVLQNPDSSIREAARNELRVLGARTQFADRFRSLARDTFGELKGEFPPNGSTLAFAAEHLRLLSGSEQAAFVTLLSRVIGEPASRTDALHALRLLPDLGPTEREPLVQALVDAEVLEPEVDGRTALLSAADAVARSRGKARQVITARLAELESRDGDDRAVYERVARKEPHANESASSAAPTTEHDEEET